MDRTAEEFVHQLPTGRWFVADFIGRDTRGDDVFLVEVVRGRDGVEVSMTALAEGGVAVRTYSRKASAKRAAQRLIERLLDEDEA